MFPVYGLAEASLAVSFPPLGARYHASHFDRHRLSVGQRAGARCRRAIAMRWRWSSVGRRSPAASCASPATDDSRWPTEHVGHIQIRGDNVTGGYSRSRRPTPRLHAPTAGCAPATSALIHDGELYITGRAKEIIFVNGQNYYPHDLEAIAQRARASSSARSWSPACAPPGAETDELMVFVLHRGALEEFLPLARAVARRINEHAGLEVAQVVPVRRIPKTTSGKIQRHLLEQEYLAGDYAAELAALRGARRRTRRRADRRRSTSIERTLQAICDAALDRPPRRAARQPVRPRRQLAEADRASTSRSTAAGPARSMSPTSSTIRPLPRWRASSRAARRPGPAPDERRRAPMRPPRHLLSVAPARGARRSRRSWRRATQPRPMSSRSTAGRLLDGRVGGWKASLTSATEGLSAPLLAGALLDCPRLAPPARRDPRHARIRHRARDRLPAARRLPARADGAAHERAAVLDALASAHAVIEVCVCRFDSIKRRRPGSTGSPTTS